MFLPAGGGQALSGGTDDLLIATLETGLQIGGDSATAPATIHYVHTDHLTGSNVVTDEQRRLEETVDYYPFGEVKLDTTTTNFKRNMV